MNKNLLLALCVAVAAPCLAQQKSQTRLLQKTTNTTDVQSGSATTETTSYNYGENGWLATESSNNGDQYAYEYELNGAGYMVKQVICKTDANGVKRYTKTERTLNENNKPLKIVQYVKNGDADYLNHMRTCMNTIITLMAWLLIIVLITKMELFIMQLLPFGRRMQVNM